MVEEGVSGCAKNLCVLGHCDEEFATNFHVDPRPYPGFQPVEVAQSAVSLAIVASVGAMCLQLGSP